MANNDKSTCVRPNGRRAAAAPGRIVGGRPDAARRVWPASLPSDAERAPAPRLKGMSSSAGRRITTVSIETSDPVAYVTSRPDPLTLFIDLRDVDASGARSALLGAKGILSGAAVEEATGADGARVARVRIRLTDAGRSSGAQQAQRHSRRFRQRVPAGLALETRRRRRPARRHRRGSRRCSKTCAPRRSRPAPPSR